jgi:hypothetical protein
MKILEKDILDIFKLDKQNEENNNEEYINIDDIYK